MTKSQTIEALSKVTGFNKKDVNKFLDGQAAIGYEAVKVDGEFIIPYFGKLVKVKRKARIGRNPMTGESVKIPAKTVVKFRVMKAIKDALNS